MNTTETLRHEPFSCCYEYLSIIYCWKKVGGGEAVLEIMIQCIIAITTSCM